MFNSIQQDFQSATPHKNLQLQCSEHAERMNCYNFMASSKLATFSSNMTVDHNAQSIWPSDVSNPEIFKLPECVKADGS